MRACNGEQEFCQHGFFGPAQLSSNCPHGRSTGSRARSESGIDSPTLQFDSQNGFEPGSGLVLRTAVTGFFVSAVSQREPAHSLDATEHDERFVRTANQACRIPPSRPASRDVDRQRSLRRSHTWRGCTSMSAVNGGCHSMVPAQAESPRGRGRPLFSRAVRDRSPACSTRNAARHSSADGRLRHGFDLRKSLWISDVIR